MLTVDEPDGGHGDGEEDPGAHVHLNQHRRQGKEEQDDQQAAQNPHPLRNAVWKGVNMLFKLVYVNTFYFMRLITILVILAYGMVKTQSQIRKDLLVPIKA